MALAFCCRRAAEGRAQKREVLMQKRISARLATLIVAGLTSIAASGCMVEGDPDEGTDEAERVQLDDTQASDVRDQSQVVVQPGETNIQVHDYNGICADSLTLRDVPGGITLCTMSYRNPVYVYDVNGAWAYVRVLAGHCEGHVGWALKDYISRTCL
jgi:hypothetical protein